MRYTTSITVIVIRQGPFLCISHVMWLIFFTWQLLYVLYNSHIWWCLCCTHVWTIYNNISRVFFLLFIIIIIILFLNSFRRETIKTWKEVVIHVRMYVSEEMKWNIEKKFSVFVWQPSSLCVVFYTIFITIIIIMKYTT